MILNPDPNHAKPNDHTLDGGINEKKVEVRGFQQISVRRAWHHNRINILLFLVNILLNHGWDQQKNASSWFSAFFP